jgi:DNA-binding transcriptional MerR regulator
MQALSIGLLASRTGTTVPTIRYYEEIGLLPHAPRAANGHRFYREADLKRLTFIKRCRDFGFPIEQVRDLAQLFEDGDRACVEARNVAQMQLDKVRARLEEMRELEKSLVAFVASCDEACCQGATRDCSMLMDLASLKPEGPQRTSEPCCSSSAQTTRHATDESFKVTQPSRT